MNFHAQKLCHWVEEDHHGHLNKKVVEQDALKAFNEELRRVGLVLYNPRDGHPHKSSRPFALPSFFPVPLTNLLDLVLSHRAQVVAGQEGQPGRKVHDLVHGKEKQGEDEPLVPASEHRLPLLFQI